MADLHGGSLKESSAGVASTGSSPAARLGSGRSSTKSSTGSVSSQVLGGLWRVNWDQTLGVGGYATVYRGMDQETLEPVAIKVYKMDAHPADDIEQAFKQSLGAMCLVEKAQSTFRQFAQPVAGQRSSLKRRSSFANELVLDDIGAVVRGQPQGDFGLADVPDMAALLSKVDVSEFFVKSLDHSRTEAGRPGVDSESHCFFIVYELGIESLAETFEELVEKKETLSVEDLRDIQWCLCCCCCCLHVNGMVHLDIKPSSIMKFSSGRWKLIDFDNLVQTRSTLTLIRQMFTPLYVAPEVARGIQKSEQGRADPIQASRLMDVWSIGLIFLEAVFLQPILSPWYNEWLAETKSEDKFFNWLGNFDTEPLLSADMEEMILGLDPDLCSLLQGMLAKDPSKRFCIAQCLTHPFFQPLRTVLWQDMLQGPRESAREPAPPATTITVNTDPSALPGCIDDDEKSPTLAKALAEKHFWGVPSAPCDPPSKAEGQPGSQRRWSLFPLSLVTVGANSLRKKASGASSCRSTGPSDSNAVTPLEGDVTLSKEGRPSGAAKACAVM